MRLLKWTGLLMFMSMLAVGCSDDDENAADGKPAELYVTVYDDSDSYLLRGVEVEFVQNNKVLCVDTTDDNGIALCDNKWDGLVSGMVTINIEAYGYKRFTQTEYVREGENEIEVRLTPDKNAQSAITVTTEDVEDFYGVLSVDMEKNVASVRVSEGGRYDASNYDEYLNPDYGYRGFIQRVTYTNLIPETKYTLTVASFDKSNNQLDAKTISFTTKAMYNRSTTKLDIVDFLSIGNGVSVTFQNQPTGFYLACYEVDNAPTNDERIIMDAFRNSEMIKDSKIGCVDGLKNGTKYRVYVVPVSPVSKPESGYQYNAPGKLSFMDLVTKDERYSLAQATVVKYSSNKGSFSYKFRSSGYSSYGESALWCKSYRAVSVDDYDQVENQPDIVWATLCHSGDLGVFNAPESDIRTWSGLNLTSWYGIVTLGYSDARGENNSSIITRYKFKYGNYDATTRSAEPVLPAPSTGIRYGAITNDMLKRVHVLK